MRESLCVCRSGLAGGADVAGNGHTPARDRREREGEKWWSARGAEVGDPRLDRLPPRYAPVLPMCAHVFRLNRRLWNCRDTRACTNLPTTTRPHTLFFTPPPQHTRRNRAGKKRGGGGATRTRGPIPPLPSTQDARHTAAQEDAGRKERQERERAKNLSLSQSPPSLYRLALATRSISSFFLMAYELEDPFAALISSSARHSAMVLMLRKADSRAPVVSR